MPSRPNPAVLVAGSNPSPSSRTLSSTVLCVLPGFDHRSGGVAVLGGVGQRFLDDPVDRGLKLRGVARRFAALLVGELDRAVDLQAVTARAFAQRRERGGETELIQRGGAQIGDERAEVGDPVLEMVDRLGDGFFQHLPRRPCGEPIDKLSRRPARLCSVSSCSSRAQRPRSASAAASRWR